MYNYLYLRIQAFVRFSLKFWLTEKKIYKRATQYSPLILYLQDNQEQTDTTPLTQLEKSTKNDQQTKGKKKRKKKNKAQSKAQSEEQNRVEMVTDNRLEEDPPGKNHFLELWMGNAPDKVQFFTPIIAHEMFYKQENQAHFV